MNPAKTPAAALVAAGLAAVALLLSCGKDKSTNSSGGGQELIRIEVDVSVDLGTIVLHPDTDLEIVTPLETVDLDSTGSGALRLNTGYFQLVQAVADDTVPVFMAISPPPKAGSEVRLDPFTTAVSLIYLTPFICQSDTAAARQVLDWIRELPETAELAGLFAAMVSSDGIEYLLTEGSARDELLASAQRKILEKISGPVGAPAGSVSAASVITPPGEQDGITIVELAPSGTTERFRVTNFRRRWLSALVPSEFRHIPSRGGITSLAGPPSIEFSFDVDSRDETPVRFYGPGIKDLNAIWPVFDDTERHVVISSTTLTLLGDGLAPVLSTILGVGKIPDNLLLGMGTCLLNDFGFKAGMLADFEGVVRGEPWRWGPVALRTLNSLTKCVAQNPQWIVDVLESFGHSAISIILRSIIAPLRVVQVTVTVVDLGILLHDVVISRPLTVFNISAEGDQSPPAAVSDLRVGNVGSTSLTLYWTSPGDNGVVGQATSYDIRRSGSPISGDSWSAAARLEGEPLPAEAGRPESLLVTGLTRNTAYYFAVKTADEVPNWSALSNVVTTKTADDPAANWSHVFEWSDSDMEGKDVAVTLDGGCIAVGVLAQHGATYLVRLNADGNTVWERRYDGIEASSVVATPDGTFLIGGGNPSLSNDFYLGTYSFIMKVDADGSPSVLREVITTGNRNVVTALAPTSDGGCFALGSYDHGADIFVARVDGNAEVLWSAVVGGSMPETPGGIAATPDGGCIVTGMTESFIPAGYIGNENLYVVKFGAGGIKEWEKAYVNYGYGYDERGEDVLALNEGTYLVAGWDNFSYNDGEIGLHATLWRIGTTGDLVWRKPTGRLNSYARSVAMSPDGRFVLAGSEDSPCCLYLIEASTAGDFITDVAIGWLGPGTRIRSTPDGGFVAVGSQYSPARYYWSMYLQKFDLAWLESFGGS